MIYTCTLNPSIDYIMHVEDFAAGGLNRAHQTFYYPGGKGINVSRVMIRLGIQSEALGFTGGFTGAFITNFLEKENIVHSFIQTEQNSRINVKLKSGEETEINGPGPEISAAAQEQLLKKVNRLSQEDTLVLAGSIPASLPEDFYITLTDVCAKNNVRVVVDTSGKALNQLIGQPLFLIKPNHHELGDLFGVEIDTVEKAAEFGEKLLHKGIEHVIVSMGGNGAVYINKEQKLFANVPKGEVKNSVGAGDSVVAGFLSSLTNGNPSHEAFRYGVAAGSATAFQDDLCEKENVEELVEQIQISTIK
ncbi:1-phosphofructokinase [Halobacillus litoralis]|uniref:1-phosphofructokinase n=1 Tax=Halobacillus litoralis TaxID=45668 RepID=UPI001CFDDD81|nr:1-phosphofructokinase [Halobacillus litoralis]